MKYLMFYDSAADVLTRGPQFMPAHRERIKEFHARGTLLMIGTLEEPVINGAVALFATREAAEEFATGDPFVLNGVVVRWRVLAWNEILQP